MLYFCGYGILMLDSYNLYASFQLKDLAPNCGVQMGSV